MKPITFDLADPANARIAELARAYAVAANSGEAEWLLDQLAAEFAIADRIANSAAPELSPGPVLMPSGASWD